MRILFVLENFHPMHGGVETLFFNLTKQLQKEGHQAVVLTGLPNNSIPKKENIEGIEVHRFSFVNRYLFTLLAILPAIRLARGCDLIHTTSYNAGFPARIAGFFTRKKVIITFHEYWSTLWHKLPFIGSFSAYLHRIFEHSLLTINFHKYVAVSNFTQNALIAGGVNSERVERIYNGLDLEEWQSSQKLNTTKKEFNLLYFGRTGLSKGLDILLPGFTLAAKTNPNLRLKLILPSGQNKILQFVQKNIDQSKTNNIVKVEHNLTIEKLKEEIQKADAVIIPSYSEGFGYSTVEAINLNTPVVTSGKGALKEVVSGHYIEMRSLDITGCKEAIDSAFNGDWNFTPVKQFDIKTCVHNYINLYKNILN